MLMGIESKPSQKIGDFAGFAADSEKREGSSIDLRWHVLMTEPNSEIRARNWLRDKFKFAPFVPTEPCVTYRTINTMFGVQRRRVESVRPIFRGYLFLPLNLAWSFGPIHTTPGLRKRPFMQRDGNCVVLPASEIEKLQKLEYARHNPDKPILPYKVGDKVRVVEGPFMDMVMRVSRLDDERRIELLMDILGGRDVKFFVEAYQIVAVN